MNVMALVLLPCLVITSVVSSMDFTTPVVAWLAGVDTFVELLCVDWVWGAASRTPGAAVRATASMQVVIRIRMDSLSFAQDVWWPGLETSTPSCPSSQMSSS